MQTTLDELVGDQIRVSVMRKEACKVEFHVHANKDLVDKARMEAAKGVGKEVTVPGFRKGKAPEGLILKNYAGEIERRFHKDLADTAFVEAQKLAKVPVLNKNSTISFDLKGMSDAGADVIFRFETEPVAPSVDPKLFVKKAVESKEVGEKEIDEAIRQMAFFYAKWEDMPEQAVQEGDFIMIDLDTIDGEPKRVFDQVRFEVKPERMANWMRNLVIGAKTGDVLEGVSEPDENADDKEEFSPKKVRVTIRKVERATLPPMDDEFAKKVGANDVAGMRDLVGGILKKQVEDKADSDLREQVNHFLVTRYVFDIPESLVRSEFEHRYSKAKQNPEFLKHIENVDERKKIEERIKTETEQSLRLFYLSKHIVEEAKLPISHQEVNRRAVEHRKSAPWETGNAEISKEEYALAVSMVFLSKAQDFVMKNSA